MPTSHFWREWEGHTIAGQYRLSRMWGNTEHTAVFVSESKIVKLISREAAAPGDALARFGRVRQLSHPGLMPLLDYGTETRDGQEFYYVVTEQATDDLSRLLKERALSPEEARDVLSAVLRSLGYLHEKGLVHGSLRPSNVMIVEDQLKLSSDTIQEPGPANGRPSRPGPYDAPELVHDEVRLETDIWMLGALLYEALTRSTTMLADANENLPAPFNTIVRGCLRKDPGTRWTLTQIQDLLDGRMELAPEATQQYADPVPAPRQHSIIPPMKLLPRLMLIAAAVVIAVVCFAVLGRGPEPPATTPPAPAAPPPQATTPPPAPAEHVAEAEPPAPKAQKAHRRHRRRH